MVASKTTVTPHLQLLSEAAVTLGHRRVVMLPTHQTLAVSQPTDHRQEKIVSPLIVSIKLELMDDEELQVIPVPESEP
jgi:hypothetical protein